jgi:hypothetical protein
MLLETGVDMKDNNTPDRLNNNDPLEEEEIIELTEEMIVTSEADEEPIELTEAIDESFEQDETAPVPSETQEMEEDVELADILDDDLDTELDVDEDADDDFVGSLGMEIDSEEVPEPEAIEEGPEQVAAPPEQVAVTSGQVEEALERVIKKMLSEKIESILVEMIEKTVTKEIERLKSILLEDSTGSE